jgi:hypothetical protein
LDTRSWYGESRRKDVKLILAVVVFSLVALTKTGTASLALNLYNDCILHSLRIATGFLDHLL